MTTKYSFSREVYGKEVVDHYTLGFNEGFHEGFRAGLEAAKQAIITVEENAQSNHEESR